MGGLSLERESMTTLHDRTDSGRIPRGPVSEPNACHLHLFGPAEGCPTCARNAGAYSPGSQLNLLSSLNAETEQNDPQGVTS